MSSRIEQQRVETVRPAAVRGNHFHPTAREVLLVVHADAWTLFLDDEKQTFAGTGAVRIEIEPGRAHAIRNDGRLDLHVVVLSDAPGAQPRVLVEPLARLAGVDGVRGGWLAVVKDQSAIELRLVRTDDELLALFRECAVVAIDVPIGLPDSGPRLCDRHARRFLGGKRASSVFSAPLRPLLALRDYGEANRISQDLQKRGISKQGWAIVPKIGQVDRLLQRHHDLRSRVHEVHPDVSFRAWARDDVPTKHGHEGLDARRMLVLAHFGEIPPLPRRVHENDLLDAFAALWTAERIAAGTAQHLGDAHLDLTGLPMRIVY